MTNNQTTNQNPSPTAATASVPDQYNAYFQDAAKQTGIKPEFLLDIAATNLKDGKLPAMDDQARLFIASEHGMKPNLQDINQQWQLYAFYMAEQIADSRDITQALYTIDFGDKNQAATASNLLSHALEHSSKIGGLIKTSTDSQYIPSPMGVAMIKNFEGFRNKAYSLGGITHIGYGHSQNAIDNPGIARPGNTITEPEAAKQLATDLQKYGAEIVHRWPDFLKLPQGVQDACVSYAYNCGVGGFMKSQAMELLKQGKLFEGAEAIAHGIHTAGGVDNKALEARRKIESNLAKMGLQDTSSAPQIASTVSTNNLGKKVSLNTAADASNAGRQYNGASGLPQQRMTADATPPVHAAALNATNAPAPGLGT